jgi:hypothetical protein
MEGLLDKIEKPEITEVEDSIEPTLEAVPVNVASKPKD